MSIWLQKRLAVWMGVALLGGALVGVSAVRAQNEKPNVSDLNLNLTRDEVAKRFSNALNYPLPRYQVFSLISAKSRTELGAKVDTLFQLLSTQWKQPAQTVKVQSEGDKTATVVVENSSTSQAKPLVLIEEGGIWGVDLVETYAKWNNLQGVAKAETIYKLTGVVLDELPRTNEINRNVCQANLKESALGIMQYVADWDEKLPPAKSWCTALIPYVANEAIFSCPALPKGKSYGYAFNSKFSLKFRDPFSQPTKTVLLYETSILKRNAYGTGENLAFRHQSGANFAFADGHVKWFAKTATPSFKLRP